VLKLLEEVIVFVYLNDLCIHVIVDSVAPTVGHDETSCSSTLLV
jgi:hypothetical protein